MPKVVIFYPIYQNGIEKIISYSYSHHNKFGILIYSDTEGNGYKI